jgi:hypothetical protein
MIVRFAALLTAVISHAEKGAPNNPPSLGFFPGFAGISLAALGVMALNLFIGISYAIKAGHRKWARRIVGV